jgi:hypothetical protein
MKLLMENWRKYITEDWRDTSWKIDDDKVTIGEVVDYLGDETVDINVGELIEQLPTLSVGGGNIDEALNRMAAASLDYPIIVVKSGGQYRYVLDGNHRLGKAYVCGGKDSTIKAKILDVSEEAETPERFKRAFGGAG